MGTCFVHRETLIMDVHGELTAEDRAAWEEHLAVCDSCRKEKEQLCALVRGTREGFSVPSLSSEEEHMVSSGVQRRLRLDEPDAVPKRLGWRIAPAFAACIVILFAGWFGLKDFRAPDTPDLDINGALEEQIITENQELIENMDLLQEMEALEQLVNLLDEQYPETSLRETEGDAGHVRVHV
jgi:anti-sigma factor RsiW